jgi:hypothetical protein
MKKIYISLLYTLISLVPTTFSLAATGSPNTGNPSNTGSPNLGNPSSPGSPNLGNPSGGVTLNNPLGDKDILEFLQDILDVIMIFAVPLIVFMIIYAGFLFVMDRGSEKNLKQAKNALLYAVIGAVIIFGAKAILEVVQGTVDAFR